MAGRPRGEYRAKLLEVARQLVGERGCFNARAAAAAGQVRLSAAQLTLKDMYRAGELVVVGKAREPGVCRPVNLYAFPKGAQLQGADALAQVARSWAAFQ